MINKKLGILLLSCILLMFSLNGVLAYTLQFPLCNPPAINTSCINYSVVAAVTTAPAAIMYFGQDGNLYLTNDTPTQYIVNNYTTTYPVYQVTNITNVTNYYSYNISNGSNVTIIENITVNDTILAQWLENLNITNASMLNLSVYNRSEAEAVFAFKSDLTNLQNSLINYATKTDINNLNVSLTLPNGSKLNMTLLENLEENKEGIGATWTVIIVLNLVLTIVIILFLVRSMMSGG